MRLSVSRVAMRKAVLAAVAGLLVGCSGTGPRTPAHTGSADTQPAHTGGYRLPVDGRWRVHRTHYQATNDQSSAIDLVFDARLPEQQGAGNFEYPSYGKTIVADASGVVVTAVDGIADNPPGIQNGYDAHGNYVVIDHRDGRYSLFAHLVPGSLQVRAGDRVGMGQPLGKCGNSGRSTMPHLHWQVMDHPHAHRGRGVAIPLRRYEKNGKPSVATLQRADRIMPLD